MTNISTEITIRPYTESDKQGVIDLFTTVFDVPRSEKDWNWKYQGYFQEESPLIFIAEVREKHCPPKIVGTYSATRYPLSVLGRNALAYQAVDIAVDKEFQKRGIRKKLFDQFMQELEKRNGLLLFGFPGKYHFDIGEKFGDYMGLGSFTRFECNNFSAGNKFHPAPDYYRLQRLENLFHYAGELLVLSQLLRSSFPVCIIRDVAYLQHRYQQHPKHHFECYGLFDRKKNLIGFCAFRIEQTTALIYELYCQEESHSAEAFVAFIQQEFASRKIFHIKTWLRGQSSILTALLHGGFVPHPDELLLPAIALPSHTQSERALLMDAKNWYLSYGDTDL